MRRLPMIPYVSLLLALAAGPAAVADPSGSVWMELEFTRLTNVGLYTTRIDQSWSHANVLDSLGHSSSSSQGSSSTYTTASADIGTASGYAETTGLGVSAQSAATPRPLADWSRSWSSAVQDWYFEAVAAGPVRFEFDLNYEYDLETAHNGEEVLGILVASWWLHSSTWDKSSGGHWGWGSASPLIVQDGGCMSATGSIPCFVEISGFAAGEGGFLDIRVETYVSAVPIPSAILLGMLGLGAAGVRLRKYT